MATKYKYRAIESSNVNDEKFTAFVKNRIYWAWKETEPSIVWVEGYFDNCLGQKKFVKRTISPAEARQYLARFSSPPSSQ